ncbi:Ig-like domain-containing protein [Martelella alba]|nr:Ig-like domain-containing protein [Martelella alba]
MSYQLTLTTSPLTPALSTTARTCELTAIVADVEGHPQQDIPVYFQTTHDKARLSATTCITDDRGTATATLRYPVAATRAAVGMVQVTAAITGSEKTISVNFFDPALRPVRVLNSQCDAAGTVRLGQTALAFGLQMLVYFPKTIADGDKAIFHWGEHIARKTLADKERVWVVTPQILSLPAKALEPGTYRVWYSLETTAGQTHGAKPVNVEIVSARFPSPTVQDARGDALM